MLAERDVLLTCSSSFQTGQCEIFSAFLCRVGSRINIYDPNSLLRLSSSHSFDQTTLLTFIHQRLLHILFLPVTLPIMRVATVLAFAGGALCAIAQSFNNNFDAGGAVCSVNTPSTVVVTKEVTVFTSMEATATATSFALPSSSGVYYFSAENGTTVWFDGISPSETALIVLQTSTIEVTEVPTSSTTGMTRLTTEITTATRFITSTVILTSSKVLSSDDQSTTSTVTILSTTTQTAFVALALPSISTLPSNTTSINTMSTQANETIVVTEMKQITFTTTEHPAFTRPIFGWNITSPSNNAAMFNNTTLLTVFGSINKPNMTLAYGTAT